MKILAVDIGTGTQDILLYDSRVDIENCFKLILPSPTMMINHALRRATIRRDPVLLTGFTMGGGPSAWAAEAHAKAGNRILATPDAARSFNDDLDKVKETGIEIISEDEAQILSDAYVKIELRDFYYSKIMSVFKQFGINLDDLAAVCVAVFDHGAAPPEVSDRKFRFDYLHQRITLSNKLSTFAFLGSDIPPIMTRFKAVAASVPEIDLPLVIMDSAPAAILGATFDPIVFSRKRKLIANIGNFHTLAFILDQEIVEGFFEHHTGLLDAKELNRLFASLADGSLTNEEVFNSHGHGALLTQNNPLPLDRNDYNFIVTGPRRSMITSSDLKPYFAVPFGDMMISGCIGLLAAAGDLLIDLKEPILQSLGGSGGSGTPPWELSI